MHMMVLTSRLGMDMAIFPSLPTRVVDEDVMVFPSEEMTSFTERSSSMSNISKTSVMRRPNVCRL